jgi:hypothetical protein
MLVKGLQFVAIVAIALSLVPAGAHLLEMPNKMGMERVDYLITWLFRISIGGGRLQASRC